MVISFGCYWFKGGDPQSPDCWSSCNVWGKMGAVTGYSGIIMEDVCENGMWNLVGRLVLMLMRAGILVGEVVVMVVGMMVVVAVGVLFSSENWCLSVSEVQCLGLGFWLVGDDIFDFGGGFVAVMVEIGVDGLELDVEVGAVVSW